MKAFLKSAPFLILMLTLSGCDGGIVGTGSGPEPEAAANMDSTLDDPGLVTPEAPGAESSAPDTPGDVPEDDPNQQEIEVAPGYQAWLSINTTDTVLGWQQLHALTVLASKIDEIGTLCPPSPQNTNCSIDSSQISAYYGAELMTIENRMLENWMIAAGLNDVEKAKIKQQQQQASVENSTFTLGEVYVSAESQERIIETTGITSGSGDMLPPVLIRQIL